MLRNNTVPVILKPKVWCALCSSLLQFFVGISGRNLNIKTLQNQKLINQLQLLFYEIAKFF